MYVHYVLFPHFQLYLLTLKFKYKYNSGCLFVDEQFIHIFHFIQITNTKS